MFWQELQVYILLKNTGDYAEAVIIDRRIDYDSEGDDYYVTYQFTAPLPLARGRHRRMCRVRTAAGRHDRWNHRRNPHLQLYPFR